MLEAALDRRPEDTLTPLAAEARAGGPAAAERLWSVARPRLVRIGLALGVPPDDVPDLVQEVLLAAHRRLDAFDPARGRFEAWLATILVRRVRNHRRGLRRRLRFLAGFRREPRPVGLDATDARLTLERLVAGLTPAQRDVVAVYEIGELPADEAARVLGITAAGVRSNARDARRRLAALAQEEKS